MTGGRFLTVLLALILAPFATAGPLDAPDDDAGTGRDAPDGYGAEILLEPGFYHGALTLASDPFVDDRRDVYAFHASVGDELRVRVQGNELCYALETVTGEDLDGSCVFGTAELFELRATAPADGTYFIRIIGFTPQSYCFGFALNARAPAAAVPDAYTECGLKDAVSAP